MNLKKINNWSLSGFVGGILFILFFAVRYLWIWYDVSQALIYILSGVLILSVSWLYDVCKRLESQVDNLEQALVDREILK